MARDRMIRKKFWDDRKLSRVSRDARLLFIGLWNLADDLGVLVADNLFIKSKVFPYDQIQLQQFSSWLNELHTNGFISQFSHNSEDFYYLPNFSKHQTINRPNFNDLLIPKPLLTLIINKFTDKSVNHHGGANDISLPNIREVEVEVEEKEKRHSPEYSELLKTENPEGYTPGAENTTPPDAPPSSLNGPPLANVESFFRGAGGTNEMARKFWDKWESSDWMDGRRKITKWAAAANSFITTYHEIEKQNGEKRKGSQPTGAVVSGDKEYIPL